MQYQRDAEKRVRIGVVGVGSHSYRNILPTLTYLPVELVALADVNAELVAKTAKQYGVAAYTSAAEMYAAEEIDAVILCVSPALHPVLAVEAFAAGKHVWLEKPAGVRVQDVDDMIAARGDLVGVVGYKKAFMPSTRKAIELLSLPETGPLQTATGIYHLDIPEDGARLLAERATPNWLVNGCHPLSALLAVAGPARTATVHRSVHRGGALVLSHENGAISTLVLADGLNQFQPFDHYEFITQGRSVRIENTRRVVFQRGIPFAYGTGTSFAPEGTDHGALVWEAQDSLNTLENKAVFTQGVHAELDHFFSAILAGEAATIGTFEFARHLMAVYEASMLSGGSTVEVAA